jgi:glycosyltransferase involved in cell wall biosynthesis
VLLFSSFADRGWGGQESLFHLASALDGERFRPCALVPGEGSLARSCRARGIDVRMLDLPAVTAGSIRRVITGLRQLSALVDELAFDILHTDGPRNTLYAGIVGRLKHRPVVWHVRTSIRDPYDPLLFGLSSKIILVAQALACRFPHRNAREKLHTIHNGVDLDYFTPGVVGCRQVPGAALRPDEVVLTVAARVEEAKGQLSLIDACSRIHLRRPLRLRILFAGRVTEPNYHAACLRKAQAAGLGDAVHFLGHVDDMQGLLNSSDIVALPSVEGEAFPRSILEAMACGKPVVATDVGGVREAVLEGRTGFLVPAGAPAALASRVQALVVDETLRERMGQSGRRRAEALFGAARAAARTVDVYEDVLGCGRPGGCSPSIRPYGRT